jgi:hypothetical protein
MSIKQKLNKYKNTLLLVKHLLLRPVFFTLNISCAVKSSVCGRNVKAILIL